METNFDHDEKYLTESEQVKEAVRRLRLLGISEEEIEAFESEGIIPVIEDDRDGVRRGENCQFYKKIYTDRKECFFVHDFFDELKGKLPYLIFDSRGVLMLSAVLYVEDKCSDSPDYQKEFKEDKDELMLTALGSSGGFVSSLIFPECMEYGAIVVRLTGDGPVRVG